MFYNLNPKIGEKLSRITPPSVSLQGSYVPAYIQTGTVVEITDTEVVVEILVDIPRKMRFDKITGMESEFGTFLVRPDFIE